MRLAFPKGCLFMSKSGLQNENGYVFSLPLSTHKNLVAGCLLNFIIKALNVKILLQEWRGEEQLGEREGKGGRGLVWLPKDTI